jgi:tetratricopeptide (TPR) repeat protein
LFQWQNAKIAYEKAIALDEDNALAFQGLSTVYRRLGDNQQTVDCALRALSLLHRLPLAHFNLGVAMARSGENTRAVIAFETALRFQPEMVNAHRYLATIHKNNGGDREKAKFHRSEVFRLTRSRGRRSADADSKREKLFDLPEIPKREERLAILLKERPDPKPADETKSGKTFVLVSGLPRSGTSLMMQLLEAGGMPLMTDGERAADVDNPRGYYEWEAIKQIGKRPELLDDQAVNGRAIKCISMLLPRMPLQHDYKVIFMTRPIEEVVASQRQMVNRLGKKAAELDPEQLQRGLTAHREEMLQWLATAPHMKFIEIDYPALVRDPQSIVSRLVQFLGAEQLPNETVMAAAVVPSLHRQKR